MGIERKNNYRKYIDYVYIFVTLLLTILLLTIDKDTAYCLGEKYSPLYLFVSLGVIFWAIPRSLIGFDYLLARGPFVRKSIVLVISVPVLIYGMVNLINLIGVPIHIQREDLVSDTDFDEGVSLFWSIYYHFIDPGNQHMSTTATGRFCASVIAILGALLMNGLLISMFIGCFDRRKDEWKQGEVRYTGLKGHYVVIGGSDVAQGIVRQVLNSPIDDIQKKKRYILILTSCEVEHFRRELFSDLTEAEQRRIIIYYGDRTSISDIKSLYPATAEELYLLGEETRNDDMESHHDSMNMQCLSLIGECCKERAGDPLKCRVMFEYQTTFSVMQIVDELKGKIKFLPFNYYEMWAQQVFISKNLNPESADYPYLPLEGKTGIKSDEDTSVHLIVVGMSRMGVAMAIEAAHLAHYPNFITKKKRTRITFIDKNMEQEMDFFMGRFKELFAVSRWRHISAKEYRYHYGKEVPIIGTDEGWNDPLCDNASQSYYKGDYLGHDFVDVEWEFIDGTIEEPYVQDYLKQVVDNERTRVSIAICLTEANAAMAAALYLPNSVFSRKNMLQVLIYQRSSDAVVRQLATTKRYYGKLKAFGMASECYKSDLILDAETIGNKSYDFYEINSLEEKREILEDLKNNYEAFISLRNIPRENSTFTFEHISDLISGKADFDEFKKEYYKKYYKKSELEAQEESEAQGKTTSAKLWSSYYNANIKWTKLRCCGFTTDTITKEEYDRHKDMMCMVEHNRWIIEQLLLRYKPLKPAQQAEICALPFKIDRKLRKDNYKSYMAHLDICSNDRLKEIDPFSPHYDEPWAYFDIKPKKHK